MPGKNTKKGSGTRKNLATTSEVPAPVHKYLDGTFLWFQTREQLTRFRNQFANRYILPPRFTTPRYLSQTVSQRVQDCLVNGRFREFILIHNNFSHPPLIRAFYSNLRKDDNGEYFSTVNGVNIYLSEEYINTLTKLPNVGDDISDYVGEDGAPFSEPALLEEVGLGSFDLSSSNRRPTITNMPPDFRLIVYIITRLLKPRKSSHTTLTQVDTKIMHAILHGARINWCKFILQRMFDATDDDEPLPYALLVMLILEENGINTKVGPRKKATGHWEINENSFHPGLDTRPRRPRRASAPITSSSSAVTLDDLVASIEALAKTVDRIDQNVQAHGQELHAFLARFDYVKGVATQGVPVSQATPAGFKFVGQTSGGQEGNQEEEEEESEEESTENSMSLDPQGFVLNQMEENMAEKKKKRSENTSTEAIPNLEAVPSEEALACVQLPVTELQELDVNTETNSSNRKQKKRKTSKVNTPAGDAVYVDATAPQPLALVLESTAKLLSPKPQDVVLDPMDNCMDGKKKKNSGDIPTEAISNLEVVPHKTEGSVQLPAPECQELDVNIEANSSNKQRKKRKKNEVNKPTSDVEVDPTSGPHPHAPEHQERVTNVTREMGGKSSSGIKCLHGEGKKNQHKPTSDAVDVPSARQPLPREGGIGQNRSSEERKKKKKKNLTSNVIDTKSTGEVLVPDNLERDTLSPKDIEENNDNGRKRQRGETDVELAAQVIEPVNQDMTNKTKGRNVTKGEVEEMDNVESEETEALCADTINISSEDVNVVSVSTNNALDVKKTAITCENGLHLAFPEKNAVAESYIEGTCPSSSTGVTMDVIPCLRRKLLILDLNGLLADIVMPPPEGFKPDARFMNRAVFKRPFCDDFLKFCFERFDLAIWSSRSKKIFDRVVDYLLGDLKHKLLFCWDMSHATTTGFSTLENKDKPLVFKDLRNIWETRYPGLPWKKGDYDESNTLLLDDSPYKGLLNPAHTTIFPYSYNFMDKDKDNSLGPGGDLRVYLEKLADAEHVQKFVEQHPFGQPAICEKHPNWGFYSHVVRSLSPRSF